MVVDQNPDATQAREDQAAMREHAASPEGQAQQQSARDAASEGAIKDFSAKSAIPSPQSEAILQELRSGKIDLTGASKQTSSLGEEMFKNMLSSGQTQRDMFATIQNDPLIKFVRDQKAFEDNPSNRFGGDDLTSAFAQNQKSDNPLSSEEFSNRVRIAGALPVTTLDSLNKYRAKLNAPDRALFDDANFGQMARSIEDVRARQDANGPTISAGQEPQYYTYNGKIVGNPDDADKAHYFASPRAEELMKGWYKEQGIPWTGGKDTNLTRAQEMERSLRNDNEFYSMMVKDGRRPPIPESVTGSQSTVDKILSSDALKPSNPLTNRDGTIDPAFTDLVGNLFYNQRAVAAPVLGTILAKVYSDVPVLPYTINKLSGVSEEQQSAIVKQATQSLVMEGTTGPSLLAFMVPILGPTEGFALGERILANGLLGGLTAGGITLTKGETDVTALAKDFAIGAFGGATLPEVLWATGRLAKPSLGSEVGSLVLNPGELNPKRITVFHGSGGPIEGNLKENTFLTASREEAQKYAEVDTRIRLAKGEKDAKPVITTFTADPGALAGAPSGSKVPGSTYVLADASKIANRADKLDPVTGIEVAQGAPLETTYNRMDVTEVLEASNPSSRNSLVVQSESLPRFSTNPSDTTMLNGEQLATIQPQLETATQLELGFARAEQEALQRTSAFAEQALPTAGAPEGNLLFGSEVAASRGRAEAADSAAKAARIAAEDAVRVADSNAVQKQIQLALTRVTDAANPVKASIQRHLDDSMLELSRSTDSTQSKIGAVRGIAHISSILSGKLPGQLAGIASRARNIVTELGELSRPELTRLSERGDKLLKAEQDTMAFVGPEKYRVMSTTHFGEVFGSHPEWFKGASQELTSITKQMTATNEKTLQALIDLGYPIKAIEGHFYPQFWKFDPKAVDSSLTRGLVSTAKNRVFVDYPTGIAAGFEPVSMSWGQRFVEHNAALNTAIGDGFLKKALIDGGFIAKGQPSLTNGKFAFNSGLFRDYVGSRQTAEAIDSLLAVQSTTMMGVRTIASRFKNSAFGYLDLGVFGVQEAAGLIMGGPLILINGVNSALLRLHLPGAARMEWEVADQARSVFAARAGVQQGGHATGLEPEVGSVLGLIPGMDSVDKFLTKNWADRLAHYQFDNVLTPTRNAIFEGMMIVQHWLGKDIIDPAVQKTAANAANRMTLASEGAQRAGRRSIEQILATSAGSVRAELAVIGDLGKLFVGGGLSNPERIASAVSLTSFTAMMLSVTTAVAMAQGKPMPSFNPLSKKDWDNFGYVEIGNHKVAILKERTLIKAMEKSYLALIKEQPEDVATAWAQVFAGKVSPLVGGAVAATTGIGYTSGGNFKPGSMDTTNRIFRTLPVAPILTRLATQSGATTDALGGALDFFGFNTFDLPGYELRNRYVKANNPYANGDPRATAGMTPEQITAAAAAVDKSGYNGLEAREKTAFDAETAGKFSLTGPPASPGIKNAQTVSAFKDKGLNELDAAVQSDPLKKRDYAKERSKLLTGAAVANDLFGEKEQGYAANTIQGKARTAYFNELKKATQDAPAGILTGEQFGEADVAAKEAVKAALGQDGLDALERGTLNAKTATDKEFKTASDVINKSGYWKMRDDTVEYLHGTASEKVRDGQPFPFDTYKEFSDFVQQHARDNKTLPTDTAAWKLVEKLTSNAKQVRRINNPELDAALVVWYGSTPLTIASQRIAEKALGRKIALSTSSPDYKK